MSLLATDHVVHPPATERVASDVSFLVRRDRVKDLDGAAADMQGESEGRLKVRAAGPLPPWSFVDAQRERRSDREEQRERRHGRNGSSPARITQLAKAQLADLIGRPPESVSGFMRDEDGWRVTMEVVEVERIPPTTSVMASYEALVD